MALVAELERRKQVRLKARPDLGITPQKYEGKTCWVVKDPVSLRYYRFNEQEYYVVKQFDGTHTLEDAQKSFEKKFRPHRLTLEDLEAFSQQLLTAGLVQHETPQAGKQLFDKRAKQRRMQRIAVWTNILYIKLPIFDPDKLLTRMLKYTRWIFTWWFFAASVGLMLSAAILVGTHFKTFYDRLPEYHEFFRWNTLLYLWIALGIVKVIHEFGHGLSCKAFGGECHEMGALFLCLSPCLYCNVSDSWTIPSKWKRICISFAGIYVELVIAAIATWIWWYTTDPVWQHISLCVMVLCSVSTVVFNANPLMRFDGYYMLADWMEIPNLRDRSNRLLKNLWCEHCLGMEVQPEPYMATNRQVMFVAYAVLSYIYRWVITFSILYFMANWLKPYKLGVLSTLLALAALASMFGWPIYRLAKGYFKRGRVPDMKKPRVTATATVITILVGLFFFLPLPISRVRETALVLLDRESMSRGKVIVPDLAILEALYVTNGQRVFQGQLLAQFRSPKLEMDLAEAASGRDAYQSEANEKQRELTTVADADERKRIESERNTAANNARVFAAKSGGLESQIKELKEVRAPCDGIVMSAPTKEEVGKQWEKGEPTPFCLIGQAKSLIALVPVTSDDFHLLQDDLEKAKKKGRPGLETTIRVPGRTNDYVYGKVVRLPETDAKDVPIQLTHSSGGPLAVKPTNDPRQHAPQAQIYLVEVDLDQVDPNILPGTRVHVKIHCQWRTCGWWTWRKISSLFEPGMM